MVIVGELNFFFFLRISYFYISKIICKIFGWRTRHMLANIISHVTRTHVPTFFFVSVLSNVIFRMSVNLSTPIFYF
jgi:hypothetical protein